GAVRGTVVIAIQSVRVRFEFERSPCGRSLHATKTPSSERDGAGHVAPFQGDRRWRKSAAGRGEHFVLTRPRGFGDRVSMVSEAAVNGCPPLPSTGAGRCLSHLRSTGAGARFSRTEHRRPCPGGNDAPSPNNRVSGFG